MKNYLFYTLSFFLAIQCRLSGQTIYEETFDTGFPNGWSSSDLLPSSNPQKFTYQYSTHNAPPSTLGIMLGIPFESTSKNGYVYAFSGGNDTDLHQSQLISKPFDFTNQNKVFLSFYTLLGSLNTEGDDAAVVKVRSNGSDWITYYPFCNHSYRSSTEILPMRSPATQQIIIDISTAAAGVPNVEIAWEWTHLGGYIWAIDDVVFSEQHPYQPNSVWGYPSSAGTFENGSEGWTTSIISPTRCDWSWQNRGVLDNAKSLLKFIDQSFFYIPSNSACDGAMAFLADSCTAYYSNNQLFNFTTHLISPVINLSAETEPLILRFYEALHLFEGDRPTSLEVSFSTDNGNSWEALPKDERSYCLDKFYFGWREIKLSSAVLGKQKVKIRFTFNGQLYMWAIDDVGIFRRNEKDVAVSPLFFSITPDFISPRGQKTTFPLRADIHNLGKTDIDGAVFSARIKNLDNSQIVSATQKVLPNIEVGATLENQELNEDFMLPAQVGSYELQYAVYTPDDERPRNDTIRYPFEISDNQYRKEQEYCSGRTLQRENVPYAIGNCFYINKGASLIAKSINFAIMNRNITAYDGANFVAELYKWDGIVDDSTNLETSLGTPICAALLTLNNPTVSPYYGSVSLEDCDETLEEETYYVAVIRYQSSNIPRDSTPLFFGYNEERDYSTLYQISKSEGRTLYGGFVSKLNNNIFNVIGFGLDVIPSIGLTVDVVTRTSNPTTTSNYKIYPNPAFNQCFFEWPYQMRVQKIFISNSLGQIIDLIDVRQKTDNLIRYPTESIPRGYYWVTFVNHDGIQQSQPLIINR